MVHSPPNSTETVDSLLDEGVDFALPAEEAAGMPERLPLNRAFLLLRYTLIASTAYLLLVEGHLSLPPIGAMFLIALALASNVVIAQLPERVTGTMAFGLGLVLGDTTWITLALLQSGQFNAEFFYLYFFVLLLAAIGENLRLIVVGTVAVCFAYLYVLTATGGTWSWWNSPSLIRIPFLFTSAAFYGFLVERTRRERGRAEFGETVRRQAEAALRVRTGELQEEAAVSAALARVGHELISSLDTPVLLERLCQLTAEVLECDLTHTLLWRPDEDIYEPVAAFGVTPTERQIGQLLRIPGREIAWLLSRLEHEDVVQVGAVPPNPFPSLWQQEFRMTEQLCMALRRGHEIIGIQAASWRTRVEPSTRKQQRIAGGIAQLASMALANARLVEELERANRLKSDFVASMSHELRTPLNLIIGYNDMLVDGAFGEIGSDQGEILRRMSKSSRELLDLIEATLDLSRLENKRVPVDLKEVSIGELIHEIDSETQAWRHKPGVRFQWQIEDDSLRLRTDPVKLKMILKNLMVNAVKFTERGSVTVAARSSGDGVEIAVRDTGIGIASDAQAVIFEPFRQANRGIAGGYGGVGLGLYIVRRLLDVLGGTVSVESEPQRGSTFTVWLPRRSEEGAARGVAELATA